MGLNIPVILIGTTSCYYYSDSSLSLGLQNGLVIAIPIPESGGLLGSSIERIIQHALEEAR